MGLDDLPKIFTDLGSVAVMGVILYIILRNLLPKMMENQRAELADLRNSYVAELKAAREHYATCVDKTSAALEKIADAVRESQNNCILARGNIHEICRYKES
jgi:hypothetical protein